MKTLVRILFIVCLALTAAMGAQLVKNANGLAIASVKTADNLAIASVQTMNGLDNTASSFVPTDIASLVAWYNSPIAGATDGNEVVTWDDSSTGGTFDLSRIGTGPTYRTNQQNSLATCEFIAASSTAFINGGSDASTFPYTFWAVVKSSSLGSAGCILGPSADAGIEFRIDATTGFPTFNSANTAAIGTGNVGIGTTDYHIVIGTVDSSAWAFYVDGSAAGSGSHSVTLTAGRTFNMGVFNATNDRLNGFIGEAGICSAVISSGDRASLTAYLKAKWAIP